MGLFVLLTLVCLHSDPLSEGRSDIYSFTDGDSVKSIQFDFSGLGAKLIGAYLRKTG